MAINIVDPSGARYSPHRDLRQAYPEILRLAIERFNQEQWPGLTLLCQKGGANWDQLCDTMLALTEFLASPIENPDQTMAASMQQAGWFRGPEAARIGVCAMLGSVMIGQLYYAICETTPLGAPPQGMEIFMERARALLTGSDREKTRQL